LSAEEGRDLLDGIEISNIGALRDPRVD